MLTTPTISSSAPLRRRISPRLLAELAHRARRAGQLLGIEAAAWASLGLRIVEDEEMAELHLRYMGEAGPTDVLSFSPLEFDAEGPGQGEPLLGDLVLNWEAIERQARGPSDAARLDEATALTVHGLAHLLGHDHRNRQEGRRMFRLEQRALGRLGLAARPRSYAPRLLSPQPPAPEVPGRGQPT